MSPPIASTRSSACSVHPPRVPHSSHDATNALHHITGDNAPAIASGGAVRESQPTNHPSRLQIQHRWQPARVAQLGRVGGCAGGYPPAWAGLCASRRAASAIRRRHRWTPTSRGVLGTHRCRGRTHRSVNAHPSFCPSHATPTTPTKKALRTEVGVCEVIVALARRGLIVLAAAEALHSNRANNVAEHV